MPRCSWRDDFRRMRQGPGGCLQMPGLCHRLPRKHIPGRDERRTRAAVATAAGKPLEIMEVNLDGPRAGEVLVEIRATGICHTDEFTLSGADPEGLFPAILGHEGAGVVLEVGEGPVRALARPAKKLRPGTRMRPSCLA